MEEPTIINPQPMNSRGSGMGGKIGIVIIIVILLVVAYYFFNHRKDQAVQEAQQTSQADDTESLNNELNTAASANVDGDLKSMDQDFQ